MIEVSTGVETEQPLDAEAVVIDAGRSLVNKFWNAGQARSEIDFHATAENNRTMRHRITTQTFPDAFGGKQRLELVTTTSFADFGDTAGNKVSRIILLMIEDPKAGHHPSIISVRDVPYDTSDPNAIYPEDPDALSSVTILNNAINLARVELDRIIYRPDDSLTS